jgi:glycosyltransferase involved in cell wall biosynthesis
MSRARHPLATPSRSKSILIEGWRATNHSLALVNQYQILELRKLPHLRLFHADAPLHTSDWNKQTATSGFSRSDRQRIDTLSSPGNEKIDCVYRIFSPFQAAAEADRRKTLTFMVTELGPFRISFDKTAQNPDCFTRGENRIVTPSSWSRDRLIDWGFAADRISIAPHGVDSATFRPLNVAERAAARKILGLHDDDVVFLNVGAAVWNKGVDLLLLAFAHLRGAGRPIRLVLRDRIDMYGFSVTSELQKLAAKNPGLFTPSTMAAVSVIHDDLSREHLRLLYSAADCYVSPYRAEGFNLPVLEAIACGTPVIVTRGGATDDFCDDQVAIRIPGTPGQHEDIAAGHRGRYITPNMDELIQAMDRFATFRPTGLDNFAAARARVLEKFSWRNAALQLAGLAVG